MKGRLEESGSQWERGEDWAEQSLLYYGYATVNVRGPVTGEMYQFSRQMPLQAVDARDADSIVRTGLFRQVR